jgi:shikimate dehydrogenase
MVLEKMDLRYEGDLKRKMDDLSRMAVHERRVSPKGLIDSIDPVEGRRISIGNDRNLDIDDFVANSKKGEGRMEIPVPPWGVVRLEGPSIENIRSTYFAASTRGAMLFHVPFDSFRTEGTPESRVRLGVQIVQIASILKRSAIASIRPLKYGGASGIRESVRLDHLRMIASQGFQWVEIEQDIQDNERKNIMDLAIKSGSKVMITCFLDRKNEWSPPSEINLEEFNAYKILLEVNDSNSLNKAIRTSLKAKEWAKGKKIIIEPTAGSNPLSRIMGPISISDMTDIDPTVLVSDKAGTSLAPVKGSGGIWETLGIIGNSVTEEWSQYDRNLTSGTDIFMQVGFTNENEFRSRMFNMNFKNMSLDGIMIPWDLEKDGLVSCFENAKRMGVKGAFVEIPFRTIAVDNMDWTDPRSLSVGSIDVVSFNGSRAFGYNSEVYGIADKIVEMGTDSSSKVVVLGTGSGGRAAAVASAMMGMETYIAGNDIERTQAISDKLQGNIKPTTIDVIARKNFKFDIIINSIPFKSDIKEKRRLNEITSIVRKVHPTLGMDLDVRTGTDIFLSLIESEGGRTISGGEVLEKTSMRAFKLITGKQASQEGFNSFIRNEF